MSGHSKWSKVKRFKGAIDAKRGKIFSKLSKGNHRSRLKRGGGDPSANPRLRSAIQAARTQSMPNDNIERAIKRGTGEGKNAQQFDEIVYEGYAPGGVAIIVETATDNKNRTGAEVEHFQPAQVAIWHRPEAFRTCFTGKDKSPFRGRASTRIDCLRLPWRRGAKS
jgi:YebC/PmpR family DNA-binding regulatory protein